MSTEASRDADVKDPLVRRPHGHLLDLPMAIRWEATRRHPYYLTFWEVARQHHCGGGVDHPVAPLLRQAALFMLGAIGVTGRPVDPATAAADLDMADPDPGFLSGAIQPMTLRNMALTLASYLTPAERIAVGEVLMSGCHAEDTADSNEQREVQRMQVLNELAKLASSNLDSFPDAPLFYIHLEASLRTTTKDLLGIVSRFKRRRAIREKRVRRNKFAEYLRVWDLREGWTGRSYDRARELPLRVISARLKKPLPTVTSRYKAAFRLISGHDFSVDLWVRLFGPLKLTEYFPDLAGHYAAGTRRRLMKPTARPVPESVLLASPIGDVAPGMTNRLPSHDDSEARALAEDLRALIRLGRSDEEIVQELDLKHPDLVPYFRERAKDFPEQT